MSSEVCSVCLENESKYTCPACESKTCSLECVKRHKLRTECTGIVNPTKFIPNNDLISNQALVNRDYNYLLTFERKINLGKTDVAENAKQIFKRSFNQGRNFKRPRYNDNTNEDPRVDLVRKVFPNVTATSVKRENTLVIHLPAGMTRSSQNKSGYEKRSSSFMWTVEWAPIEKIDPPIKPFLSVRLKESTLLKDAIPSAVLATFFKQRELSRADIYFYLDNCVSLSSQKPSLISLNADDTLASALKDKIVLEYPKIYACLNPIAEAQPSGSDVYGVKKSEEKDSSSSSESESSSDLDESDADSSHGACEDSGLDSDDAPEEESSKAPKDPIDATGELLNA